MRRTGRPAPAGRLGFVSRVGQGRQSRVLMGRDTGSRIGRYQTAAGTVTPYGGEKGCACLSVVTLLIAFGHVSGGAVIVSHVHQRAALAWSRLRLYTHAYNAHLPPASTHHNSEGTNTCFCQSHGQPLQGCSSSVSVVPLLAAVHIHSVMRPFLICMYLFIYELRLI